MLAHDLNIFVTVAAIKLVLDAEVGKAHMLVHVREVVLSCPQFDFTRVAVRPAIALWIALVVLLKPLLVLAPQVDLQHDTFSAQRQRSACAMA